MNSMFYQGSRETNAYTILLLFFKRGDASQGQSRMLVDEGTGQSEALRKSGTRKKVNIIVLQLKMNIQQKC